MVVLEARRLLYHSTHGSRAYLGPVLRVINTKRKTWRQEADAKSASRLRASNYRRPEPKTVASDFSTSVSKNCTAHVK